MIFSVQQVLPIFPSSHFNEKTRERIALDMAELLKSHVNNEGVSMSAAALLVTACKQD